MRRNNIVNFETRGTDPPKLIETLGSNPRISKLSLRVLADNTPAVALYEKLGFSEEGRLRRAIRYRDGSYADDLMMALFL